MELSLQQLATASGVVVTVLATQGSVPRGPGTRMVVFAQGELGTIFGTTAEIRPELARAEANRPAIMVSSCLGSRYWGATAQKSDKSLSLVQPQPGKGVARRF